MKMKFLPVHFLLPLAALRVKTKPGSIRKTGRTDALVQWRGDFCATISPVRRPVKLYFLCGDADLFSLKKLRYISGETAIYYNE